MQVKEAMQTGALRMLPEDVVRTAVQRLRGYTVRHLPVVTTRHNLVGIVSMLTDVIPTKSRSRFGRQKRFIQFRQPTLRFRR